MAHAAPILPGESKILKSFAHATRGARALMTMTRNTLQHVMTDATVATTLTMVSEAIGLTTAMATRILEFGLPMKATVADGDPLVFKAMYARSVSYLPHPTPALSARLGQSAAARQAL